MLAQTRVHGRVVRRHKVCEGVRWGARVVRERWARGRRGARVVRVRRARARRGARVVREWRAPARRGARVARERRARGRRGACISLKCARQQAYPLVLSGRRWGTLQHGRRTCRPDARRAKVVLDRDRNPVQRAQRRPYPRPKRPTGSELTPCRVDGAALGRRWYHGPAVRRPRARAPLRPRA